LAPDTHIMMMSYSQVVNPTQAATECAGLGADWTNASVAFHTYGIDGKEDASLNAFYTAMKGKGIAYACTEPNLTLKAITTKLFERDGVSETQFINVHDIATNASAFTSWITSNNICWTPDFGTWPSCAGSASGKGGTGGGATGSAGSRGAGGASASGGAGGSGTAKGGSGGAATAGAGGGVSASGGSSGTGGAIAGTGGATGGSHGGTGGATGSGGSVVAGTGGAAPGSGGAVGAGGTSSTGEGGSPATGSGGSGTGESASSGCACEASAGSTGGNAAAFGLLALALVGLRSRRRVLRHPRRA
jgi:MYXO-CTERM domain-containing protein